MRVGNEAAGQFKRLGKVRHLWRKILTAYERACKPDYLTLTRDIDFASTEKPSCRKCIRVIRSDRNRAIKALAKLGVK